MATASLTPQTVRSNLEAPTEYRMPALCYPAHPAWEPVTRNVALGFARNRNTRSPPTA